MNSEKIIFLDFDGVCTAYETPGSYFVNRKDGYGPTPRCVELVRKLAENSGAKIVVSSNWRKFSENGNNSLCEMTSSMKLQNPLPKLKPVLGEYIIGITSSNRGLSKAEAILWWMNKHGMNAVSSKYVVLDDQTYDGFGEKEFPRHFIKTDPVDGFSQKDYDRAMAILS